jgi:hypothetical protein
MHIIGRMSASQNAFCIRRIVIPALDQGLHFGGRDETTFMARLANLPFRNSFRTDHAMNSADRRGAV